MVSPSSYRHRHGMVRVFSILKRKTQTKLRVLMKKMILKEVMKILKRILLVLQRKLWQISLLIQKELDTNDIYLQQSRVVFHLGFDIFTEIS